MTQVVLKTGPGDLVLTQDGATYRPYTLHGSPPAGEFWPWPKVRRLIVADGGRQVDRENLAFGFIGLLARRPRTSVTVSLADLDREFIVRQPLPAVRAAVLRLRDELAVGDRERIEV